MVENYPSLDEVSIRQKRGTWFFNIVTFFCGKWETTPAEVIKLIVWTYYQEHKNDD